LALEGAFGVRTDMFRVEAAVGYQTNDVKDDGDEDMSYSAAIRSYMVNGYADFDMDGGITPFVTGGVGLANVETKIHDGTIGEWEEMSLSQDVFAWQVGAGVGVKASDNITVDLLYRYFATSDVVFAEDGDDEWKYTVATSKLMLGMRYSF